MAEDTGKDKPDFRDFTPELDYDYHQRRMAAMVTERTSWDPHFREVSQNFMPRAGRFEDDLPNDGAKVHTNIVDNWPLDAVDTLGAGLMAGMSSPARPWMKLRSGNRDKNKMPAVRLFMEETTDILFQIFAESNTYRVLHAGYEELGVFGNNASIAMKDFQDVIRLYPMTIGEYYFAQNDRYVIDTFYRKFKMSVHQIVSRFGFDNASSRTQDMYRSRNFDTWINIAHAIEPNKNASHDSPLSKDMDFLSNYWEFGSAEDGADRKGFLSRSGFDDFPVLTPRWKVKGQDIYGHSPGMKSLGDAKELQSDHFKKARALDYQTNPPLQIPVELRGQDSWLPGSNNYYSQNTPGGGVRSAFEVDLKIEGVILDINDIRQRIDSAFFVDLFKSVLNSDRRQITAREIAEKHEEKLLLLGPVLERLQNEMLDPLIDRAFSLALRAGILPDIPRELEGEEIRVEYISMLAQAQKAIGVGSIDRLLGTVGAVAQLKPGVVDKIDELELVDIYADLLGTPAKLIIANEQVAIIRDKKQQQQEQADNLAMASEAANTAKTLSDADTAGKNALTDVSRQFSPF